MDPTSFYDSSDDGNGGGGNFAAVLNSFTQLGQTAIIANAAPNTNVPYPGPPGSYNAGGYYGAPPKAGMSMFTVLLLVGAGAFAFTKLR